MESLRTRAYQTMLSSSQPVLQSYWEPHVFSTAEKNELLYHRLKHHSWDDAMNLLNTGARTSLSPHDVVELLEAMIKSGAPLELIQYVYLYQPQALNIVLPKVKVSELDTALWLGSVVGIDHIRISSSISYDVARVVASEQDDTVIMKLIQHWMTEKNYRKYFNAIAYLVDHHPNVGVSFAKFLAPRQEPKFVELKEVLHSQGF